MACLGAQLLVRGPGERQHRQSRYLIASCTLSASQWCSRCTRLGRSVSSFGALCGWHADLRCRTATSITAIDPKARASELERRCIAAAVAMGKP
jgi:hypothetical protein